MLPGNIATSMNAVNCFRISARDAANRLPGQAGDAPEHRALPPIGIEDDSQIPSGSHKV